MNVFVYDTKGTSTDRVTSQNRLPTCYLVCVGASKIGIRISLKIIIVINPDNCTNLHQSNNGPVGSNSI